MPESDESQVVRRRHLGLKIIAGSAICLILFLGLCQLGFHLDRNIHDGAPSTIDAIGGFGFLLSAIALIIGVVVALVEGIYRIFDKPKP